MPRLHTNKNYDDKEKNVNIKEFASRYEELTNVKEETVARDVDHHKIKVMCVRKNKHNDNANNKFEFVSKWKNKF